MDEELISKLVSNSLQGKSWKKVDSEYGNPIVVYHRDDNVLVHSGGPVFSGAKINTELLKKYGIPVL